METRETMILSPRAPAGRPLGLDGLRLENVAGKIVGFIDNSKPNFNLLIEDVAQLLVERHGAAGVVKHRKRTAAERASDAVFDDLRNRCDVVIAGSGD